MAFAPFAGKICMSDASRTGYIKVNIVPFVEAYQQQKATGYGRLSIGRVDPSIPQDLCDFRKRIGYLLYTFDAISKPEEEELMEQLKIRDLLNQQS